MQRARYRIFSAASVSIANRDTIHCPRTILVKAIESTQLSVRVYYLPSFGGSLTTATPLDRENKPPYTFCQSANIHVPSPVSRVKRRRESVLLKKKEAIGLAV